LDHPVESLTYILLLTVWVYLHSNFSGGLRKTISFQQEWRTDISAVQGHRRSLTWAPIERAYATSNQSVIVNLIISCTLS